MSTSDFNSDDFHKQRLRVIRNGDIVSDSGWQEDSGCQVRVVVRAGRMRMDRAAWFVSMVFGEGQQTEDVG